jgi:hypothetical protein
MYFMPELPDSVGSSCLPLKWSSAKNIHKGCLSIVSLIMYNNSIFWI